MTNEQREELMRQREAERAYAEACEKAQKQS
jgi:hypothetical protein